MLYSRITMKKEKEQPGRGDPPDPLRHRLLRHSSRRYHACRPQGAGEAPLRPSSSVQRAAAAAGGLEHKEVGGGQCESQTLTRGHCRAQGHLRPELHLSHTLVTLAATFPAGPGSENRAPQLCLPALPGTQGDTETGYSLSKARMPPRIPRMAGTPIPPATMALFAQFLTGPSQSQTRALTVVIWLKP